MTTKKQQATRSHVRFDQVKFGDIIILRYYDAVIFKDTLDCSNIRPPIRETIGWLDYENDEYIRLIWERYAEPSITEEARIRSTGLAIRKSDIIELRKAV